MINWSGNNDLLYNKFTSNKLGDQKTENLSLRVSHVEHMKRRNNNNNNNNNVLNFSA